MGVGPNVPPAGPSLPPAANGLPRWLAPAVQVTTTLGVPTVVAGVLLYFVLARVDVSMQEIQRQENIRSGMVLEMHKALVTAIESQTTRFETVIKENIQAGERNAKELHRLLEDRGRNP